MALKQLFLFVRQQGTVMAFADVFLLLCLLFGGFACLCCGGRQRSDPQPPTRISDCMTDTQRKKAGPVARPSYATQ
jgi:hypothetical protein